MAYQVLARKWRPQNFSSLVGQEPIVTALRNALAEGRIAHAYLFSGIRGVGKTTAARVLAKALNCERGPATDPCNECTACVEIARGSDLDVLEVDAATYSKVEQVRDLTESLRYGPARDRYKVVVLDEVHRLSRQAFDALLKIVEEPPPYLVFIFATTEIEAVPATILSRCQEFQFRRVSAQAVATLLREICDSESIQATDSALRLVARAGEGSVRDAVALLDQLATFGSSTISDEAAIRLLGGLDLALFRRLLAAILSGDSTAVAAEVHRVEDEGWDPRHVYGQFLGYCRDALHLALGADPAKIDMALEEAQALAELARAGGYENLLRLLNQLLACETMIRRTETGALALEIAWLRAAELPKLVRVEELLAGTAQPGAKRLAAPATATPTIPAAAPNRPAPAIPSAPRPTAAAPAASAAPAAPGPEPATAATAVPAPTPSHQEARFGIAPPLRQEGTGQESAGVILSAGKTRPVEVAAAQAHPADGAKAAVASTGAAEPSRTAGTSGAVARAAAPENQRPIPNNRPAMPPTEEDSPADSPSAKSAGILSPGSPPSAQPAATTTLGHSSSMPNDLSMAGHPSSVPGGDATSMPDRPASATSSQRAVPPSDPTSRATERHPLPSEAGTAAGQPSSVPGGPLATSTAAALGADGQLSPADDAMPPAGLQTSPAAGRTSMAPADDASPGARTAGSLADGPAAPAAAPAIRAAGREPQPSSPASGARSSVESDAFPVAEDSASSARAAQSFQSSRSSQSASSTSAAQPGASASREANRPAVSSGSPSLAGSKATETFLHEVSARKQPLAAHLEAAQLVFEDGHLTILVPRADPYLSSRLRQQANRDAVTEAVARVWGAGATWELVEGLAAAPPLSVSPAGFAPGPEPSEQAIVLNPAVQTLLDIFGGKVEAVEEHSGAREE